jgi:hypothetical protein
MSKTQTCGRLLPWFGALALALGCEGGDSALVPVSGRVLLEGRPPGPAVITFTPTGETAGSGAVGGLDGDGRFTLTDVRGEPGAHPGQYKLSLYPTPEAATGNVPTNVVSTGSTSIPAIYLNASTSTLTATVPPTGGTIEVELTATGEGATARATPVGE